MCQKNLCQLRQCHSYYKNRGENRLLPGVAAQTHLLSAVFDLQEY